MASASAKSAEKMFAPWMQWLCLAVALVCAWVVFSAFESVLHQHMHQAQAVSRAASWAGQPVGTMLQMHSNELPAPVQ